MRTRATWTRLLPWMAAWAIAMAFLESAVVIYLRELYYPGGFKFPLAPIAPRVALTEFLRELATMVMLLAPAALVTEKWLERFAWFCFGFGVWDIFYYVFLKALLGWPATWLDRDVLFLVPVVWVGPVLAPCIISLGLITLACILLRKRYLDPGFRPHPAQWASLVLCGALFLYTFVEEPLRFIGRSGAGASTATGHRAMDALGVYVPGQYAWWGFIAATLLGAGTLAGLAVRRPGSGRTERRA